MKGHKREHFLQCLFVLAAPLLRYLALYPRLVAQKKYEKDDDDIDEEKVDQYSKWILITNHNDIIIV